MLRIWKGTEMIFLISIHYAYYIVVLCYGFDLSSMHITPFYHLSRAIRATEMVWEKG